MSLNTQAPINIVINGLVNRGIDPTTVDRQLFNAVVGIVDGVLEGERIDLRWITGYVNEDVETIIQQTIDKIGGGG